MGALGKAHKRDKVYQEILEAEVVNTSHRKASAKAKETSCWSRLVLVSKEG